MTTGTTGVFSLDVPLGAYTLKFGEDKATKATPSYEIPVRYRTSVSVAPGRTVNVGTVRRKLFTAWDIKVERLLSSATTDLPNVFSDSVKVTWKADPKQVPAGFHDARYRVMFRFAKSNPHNPEPEHRGAWKPRGDRVGGDPDSTGTYTMGITLTPRVLSSLFSEGEIGTDTYFEVRIRAQIQGSTTREHVGVALSESRVLKVRAIKPVAVGVTASRVQSDERIRIDWDPSSSASRVSRRTGQRVVARLGDGHWYVLATVPVTKVDPVDNREKRQSGARISVDGRTLTRVDGGASLTDPAAKAELLKAMTIAVETRQGSSGDWNRSATVSLAAAGG